MVKGYGEIDRIFQIDETGMVIDFVENIMNLSFARASEIVKAHTKPPRIFVVKPQVNDPLMSSPLLDLVDFLAEKFANGGIEVISLDELGAKADRGVTNVVFHMVKSPELGRPLAPVESFDTEFMDFLFIYSVPEGFVFPDNYEVVERFGATALVKVDQ